MDLKDFNYHEQNLRCCVTCGNRDEVMDMFNRQHVWCTLFDDEVAATSICDQWEG